MDAAKNAGQQNPVENAADGLEISTPGRRKRRRQSNQSTENPPIH